MVTARAPGEALGGVGVGAGVGVGGAMAATVGGPPRTLLNKVNSHLICVLCRGYYIDATTIVECLHTFCRSCIVKHLRVKSYCPVCEVMINSARPNIKLDKALQDIVYKLVPGLFQREMERRRAFYRARPELAASLTPEQRGEDTERVVFSPDDVISFSLEFARPRPPRPASRSSSDSAPEPDIPDETGVSRRFLRCPAVVNISHLKKFLSLKFDIDAANFFVDILYKRVPLPDYYTLMDVAYIYNWKRIEPMRFFYQITDFTAARDRFGFVVMAGDGRRERGPPAADGDAPGGRSEGPLAGPEEDDSADSRSPPPDDASSGAKSRGGFSEAEDRDAAGREPAAEENGTPPDVEKSQFLNSFELTAKRSPTKGTPSPSKSDRKPAVPAGPSSEREPPKRKTSDAEERAPEPKKPKSSPEKSDPAPKDAPERPKARQSAANPSVLENLLTQNSSNGTPSPARKSNVPNALPIEKGNPPGKPGNLLKQPIQIRQPVPMRPPIPIRQPVDKTKKVDETEPQPKTNSEAPQKVNRNPPPKQMPPKQLPAKRKSSEGDEPRPRAPHPPHAKAVNSETSAKERHPPEAKVEQKPESKNPPLKMSICVPKSVASSNVKIEPVKKQSEAQKLMAIKPKKGEGEHPLRSLFNSCNINIPSSLSITLTDQKLEQNPGEIVEENVAVESKKSNPGSSGSAATGQPNQAGVQSAATADQNCLEIIKLPDADNAKTNSSPSAKPNKSLESVVSAKGPVPNLKPISEAKIVPISKPQTFQQTFLQSLQQNKEKPKFGKSRMVTPKLPTPIKTEDGSELPNVPKSSITPSLIPAQTQNAFPKSAKSDSALDLSTPHPVQSHFGPQQAKALETMQSIDILAKRQQQMMSPQNFLQSSFKMRTPGSGSLRIPVPPSNNNQIKSSLMSNTPKHFPDYFHSPKQAGARSTDMNSIPAMKPISQQSTTSSSPQSAERLQTRSPSSSPKLVIACPSPKSQSPEQKQVISPNCQVGTGQSSMVSSSQISSSNVANSELLSHAKDKSLKNSKPAPGPKPNNTRPPNPNVGNSHKGNNSGESSTGNDVFQGLLAQNYLRHQLELQTRLGFLPPGTAKQWYDNPLARAHFDTIMQSMTRNTPPFGNNHNSKDK